MTVIAALLHQGAVWMAADRLAVFDGYDLGYACKQPKIIRVGYALAGFAGSSALVHNALVAVDKAASDDVDSLLAALRAELCADDMLDLEGIIATREVLVRFVGDLIPLALCGDVAACGSGGPLALGSLSTTNNAMAPELRLMAAMAAAERWCPAVGGGYDVLCVEAAL